MLSVDTDKNDLERFVDLTYYLLARKLRLFSIRPLWPLRYFPRRVGE